MGAKYVLAIAGQTWTEARRNKVFYSIFLFGLIVVLNSILFTEVTIVTVDRMLKDAGMATINVFAIALTVFAGVGIINREVDRRSIYSILAKPVSRFHYVLGKYLGLVAMTVTTTGLMFAGLLVVMVIYKTPIHSSAFVGYLGILLEVLVLGAFAVLCSSFTSAFVSAFLCAALYVSGHLSGELHFFANNKVQTEVSRWVGNAIYYVMPNLERFNFKYHVTYDVAVPGQELAITVAYALAYVAAFMVGAVVIFSNRDFR